MTEAEIAIRNALYELDQQRGKGIFNLPELRRILSGGLTQEPAGIHPAMYPPPKLITRAEAIAAGLLDLDDVGGH